MSRPVDWSSVGLWSDPIPGDPVAVLDGGRRYKAVATAIGTAVRTLRALNDDESATKSVEVVLEKKDEVADSVETAKARYDAAGEALQIYAQALSNAQSSADEALYAARSAVGNAEYYEGLVTRYRSWERYADDETDEARYRRYKDDAQSDADYYRGLIPGYQAQIAQAGRARDAAAEDAISKINTITSSDGLNDSFWDDFANVLEVIAKVAEIISSIAGILGMIFSWVPILGPALLAISAIAGLVAAVANVALAVGGKKSWGEALTSVLFAVVGCMGLGGLKGIFGALKAVPKVKSAISSIGGMKGVFAGTLTAFQKGASGLVKNLQAFKKSGFSLKNMRNMKPPKRPSWRDSEKFVTSKLPSHFREQVSFLNRHQVPYRTPGSVRPDNFSDIAKHAVEVKNYLIPGNSKKLISTLNTQIAQRFANLPVGTRQTVFLDIRGQVVSALDLQSIRAAVSAAAPQGLRLDFKFIF